MRIFLTLILAIAVLGGCQSRQQREADMHMRTMEKTVGRERLLMTVSQIAPPPMSKEIMNQSDEKVIIWIKQVDDWTHKVLSSPVTGTMDREAMQEMRRHLTQVYSPDMAQKLIDGFYRHDYRAGTYQANSTKAMLNLRSDYRTYELKREQPAPGQYRLMLSGRTTQDYSVTGMQHESAYQVQGDRLMITDFDQEPNIAAGGGFASSA